MVVEELRVREERPLGCQFPKLLDGNEEILTPVKLVRTRGTSRVRHRQAQLRPPFEKRLDERSFSGSRRRGDAEKPSARRAPVGPPPGGANVFPPSRSTDADRERS